MNKAIKTWMTISKIILPVLLVMLFITPGDAQDRANFTVIDSAATPDHIMKKAATVIPSRRQYAWQKLEFTAFLHFGINTFTDREWGTGEEDPALFNPTDFDADQWMRVLKDAGIKLVILTAKHHDGFCLWPSDYTTHDVASSPWRNGNGDVVKAVSEATDRAGLKFGVYLSPWDRHEPTYGQSDKYNTFFKNQLRELLTNYGEIDEVWFDGAKGDDVNQTYDWDGYYRLIRELQPEAVIAVRGSDVRWVGTESGYGRKTEWSVIPGGAVQNVRKAQKGLSMPQIDATAEDLGSRDKLQNARSLFWFPSEVDVSIRPGWFYHEREDDQVKSLSKMLDIYYSSVGRNSLLLLNIPPDKRGLIHENDARRLRELRDVLDQTFDKNLAAGSQFDENISSEAKKLIDGDTQTHWSPVDDSTTGIVTLNLQKEQTFNRLMLQENILEGQRVEQFRVEAWVDGHWDRLTEGTTIGYKRLLRFPTVTADKIRLRIEQARMTPAIAELGLFKAPELLSEPSIIRNKEGMVRFPTESTDPVIYYTLDGSVPTPQATRFTKPFALPDGGTVKARAYINNFGDSSEVITKSYDIAKAGWTIEGAAQSADGFGPENAIDGDPSTMWHTPWQQSTPGYPHELIIDLGTKRSLKGMTYTPRQGENISGTSYKYKIYVSADGQKWKQAAKGEFSNIKNNPIKQEVMFDSARQARYVKFRALCPAIEGEHWVSAAEIGVITK